MHPIIQELVTVPFAMRPNLKPIKEPIFNRTAFNQPSLAPGPIGTTKGISMMRQALASWMLTHRLINNDIAWLSPEGRIEALKVNNPSGWEPTEKLGLSFAELHAPLPAGTIKQALTPILALINQRWYERAVWTVSPNAHLDQRPAKKLLYEEQDEGWGGLKSQPAFRYERQYVGPGLEPGRGILFLIDVQVIPLDELDQESRELIRRAIDSMTPDVLEYKGLSKARF